MSLTLYYARMSTASATVAAIDELGLACERIRLDIDAGDTRSPAFRALNPNGRVPVLVHEGLPIWESAAIAMHLGECFGVDIGLYPAPGLRRAQAMQWIVWANTTYAEAAGRLSSCLPEDAPGAVQAGSVDRRPLPRDHEARALQARADLDRYCRLLDEALSDGRRGLLGEYSLVDTHLWVFVGWSIAMGQSLEPCPALSRWWDRCGQRPALARLFE